MHNWKKTSLITALTIILLFVGLIFVLDLHISRPSRNIAFSPGKETRFGPITDSIVQPENIILFIADGMGFGHLSLALMTQQAENISPVFDEFEIKGWHDSRSVYGPITDSEASATAMATGTSTNLGFIGLDKDRNPVQNVFELASQNGYTTAIVTDSYIWDGTPAAFVAHTDNEDDAGEILSQYVASDLDLIFGELEDLGQELVPTEEETIDLLSKRFRLLEDPLSLPEGDLTDRPVAALYQEDAIQDIASEPNLLTLTSLALEYVNGIDRPYILLVECEEMDSASHVNDFQRVLDGLKVIQQTLGVLLNYSKDHGNTLVLFTADHETGGLSVIADFNAYPDVQITWATRVHTAASVPLFATGPGAVYFRDVRRNRDIGQQLKRFITMAESGGQ